jgi:soluble lytic murein transglycosylase-like protein
MPRVLILALAATVGTAAFLAWRREASAAGFYPEDQAAPDDQGEALTFPAPAPAQPAVAGRLTPGDVLALQSLADAERWLPPADLLAFVRLESNFQPAAYRFEPRLSEASYGLMQVLESTSRDMGLSGDPRQMFNPAVGIRVGIRYTRWLWDFLSARLGREPYTHEWVGAYNAGPGNVLRGFIPWSYVRRWETARDDYARAGA